MKDKPSIKKIVFNVHGKTLELTSDEAKELKSILSDLFGEKEVQIVDRWYPQYPWTYPHWTYTTTPQITYTSTSTEIGNGTTALSSFPSDTLYLNAQSQ